MYKTVTESVTAARRLRELLASPPPVEVIVAPPFVSIAPVADAFQGSGLQVAGQNLFWETEGAFTGEVSGDMLVSAGCSHVIVGHSERRHLFGETDAHVHKKVGAALACGLVPIMCVGETDAERDQEQTFSVLDKQMGNGLHSLTAAQVEGLVIAYEPVWAIGTGNTATDSQAQEVHAFLRAWIGKKFGDALANTIRILYGGSVKPDNVRGLMAMPDIDGALVGGASLDPTSFEKLVCF